MTAREKAQQIHGKFNLLFVSQKEWISEKDLKKSKQCSILAVGLIMDNLPGNEICFVDGEPVGDYKYWDKVNAELQKL